MALGCRVDTIHPIDLTGLGEIPLTVKNVGTQIVYYKQGVNGSSVSPTSKDGEIAAGKSFVVTQPTWVIAKEPGAQLDFVQPTGYSAIEEELNLRVGRRVSVDAYGGSVNASPATNVKAINAAIKAAGNGGVVFFPDYCASKPVTGLVYEYEGEIEANGYEFLTLEGMGGAGGGGGFATTKAYTAPTSLQCVSKTAGQKQCINATSTQGFTMKGIYHYNASKQVAESSGTPCHVLIFGAKMPWLTNCAFEATGVGELYPLNGMVVLTAEGGKYDFCRFTGNKNHVVGMTVAASQAVAHHFTDCWFLGHQEWGVKNPATNWTFSNCVWEEKYNSAGEVAKGSASIISEFPAASLLVDNCWMGGSPAKEEGTHIKLSEGGTNLQVRGATLQSAEKMVEFTGKAVKGFSIEASLAIGKKGLVVAAGAKESFGTYVPSRAYYEGALLAEVTTLLEGETNLLRGSRLQTAPGTTAYEEIKAPAAFAAGANGLSTEAAMKALVEEVQKMANTLKAAGLAK